MSSATGSIKSTSSNCFSATFTIDEIVFNFSRSFASSMPAFICNAATLEYAELQDLTLTRSFDGQVGCTKVLITIDNGATISGNLNMPISFGSTVPGSGIWVEKYASYSLYLLM